LQLSELAVNAQEAPAESGFSTERFVVFEFVILRQFCYGCVL
jgi:hypothetical protein